MDRNEPALSIGLPVFNGEKYIGQAIESILAQTYGDFKLIISDNASTDQTERICRDYCLKDKRVKYYRSERNKGAAWNWNRVFELSSGLYFKWVAHDDVYDPQYLEKCIEILNSNPEIILVHSKNALIDNSGKMIGKYELAAFKDLQKPHERFREILNNKGHPTLAWLIFGVFRRDILNRSQLYGGFIDADWNFLAEISLLGRIFEIPEFLFLRRKHDQSYAEIYYDSTRGLVRNYRSQTLWWTGKTKPPLIVFPSLQSFLEFCKAVRSTNLSLLERILCYQEIISWIIWKGFRQLKSEIANEIDIWRIKINYGTIGTRVFFSSKRSKNQF